MIPSHKYFVFAVLAFAAAARAEVVDGVVATVDKEVILHSDLINDAGPALSTLQAQAANPEDFKKEAEKLLRDTLNQAIDTKILYREAMLAGMKVEEKDIDDRLDKIKKEYKSNEDFQKALDDAGENTTEFRDRLKKQLIAMTMASQKRRGYEKEAIISEADMQQYYKDHQDTFQRPERVKVRRIFIPADAKNKAARTKARAQLESLKNEIAQGGDFAQLAKDHSQGPEAAESGLIGWVKRGDLVGNLDTTAFSLGVGDVSDIIETEFGFHLLKVEAREAAGSQTFDEARTQIEPILRQKYAEDRYNKWIDDLRRRSHVRVYL